MSRAIRVVKAYVREDHEGKKFKKASENVRRLLMSSAEIDPCAGTAPLMQLTVYSCILLISWLGAQLIDRLRRDRLHHRRSDEHAELLS